MQVVQVDFPTYTIRYAGRALTCTRCGLVWDVIDFPVGHINPATYVCPDHLFPVAHPGQFRASGFATTNEAPRHLEALV